MDNMSVGLQEELIADLTTELNDLKGKLENTKNVNEEDYIYILGLNIKKKRIDDDYYYFKKKFNL